ncbi:Ras family protein [Acanthamoeba castellanii str. Neff]|uniref:Ras-related protein Rab n=1 Tax=Acanthamoeba castellanii (strain ATCC 30010 / Neff) TaxID=1257118 RepID=L8H6F8_ACACF|nr:Ras family protein [Acanthamoeba castellanii str. Neff]ELR20730.1 Ras family protein [Acanthamoeba castellanii str. Neff]
MPWARPPSSRVLILFICCSSPQPSYRYCEGYFTPNYKLTIGVDFAVKQVQWDDKTTVSLQDVAGHERFGQMTRVYYKYAIAAIIVFDLSRPATFEAVAKWREDVHSKVMLANDQPIPILLLANKCDIPGVTVDTEALDKYSQDNGFVGWFPSSAANNTNIDDAMKFMIEKVLEVAKTNQVPTPQTDTLSLEAESQFLTGEDEVDVYGKPRKEESSCCPI